jgi:hypothetical protein
MVASLMGPAGMVAVAQVSANHTVTGSRIVCLLFDGAVLGAQASHGLPTATPLADDCLTRSSRDMYAIERKSV